MGSEMERRVDLTLAGGCVYATVRLHQDIL